MSKRIQPKLSRPRAAVMQSACVAAAAAEAERVLRALAKADYLANSARIVPEGFGPDFYRANALSSCRDLQDYTIAGRLMSTPRDFLDRVIDTVPALGPYRDQALQLLSGPEVRA